MWRGWTNSTENDEIIYCHFSFYRLNKLSLLSWYILFWHLYKGGNIMTARVTIFTPKSIIMSADSRMSLGTPDNISGVETIQKVFYIRKTCTGISVFGDGRKNNTNIIDVLIEFALNLSVMKQKDVAIKLSEFMKNNYPLFHTHFVVSGYDGETPYVYEFDSQNPVLERKNVNLDGTLAYSILADLLPETIEVIKPLLPDFINISNEEVKELIDSIFEREINNQAIRYDKSKRHIDVAKPIHYLELYPNTYKITSPLEFDCYLD